MAIRKLTNQDNIKVAISQGSSERCYLVFSPPLKLRALGWTSFTRGPFPPSKVQDELNKQGPILQHMVCEFLGCTQEELGAKGYVDFDRAVEFYHGETPRSPLQDSRNAA